MSEPTFGEPTITKTATQYGTEVPPRNYFQEQCAFSLKEPLSSPTAEAEEIRDQGSGPSEAEPLLPDEEEKQGVTGPATSSLEEAFLRKPSDPEPLEQRLSSPLRKYDEESMSLNDTDSFEEDSPSIHDDSFNQLSEIEQASPTDKTASLDQKAGQVIVEQSEQASELNLTR